MRVRTRHARVRTSTHGQRPSGATPRVACLSEFLHRRRGGSAARPQEGEAREATQPQVRALQATQPCEYTHPTSGSSQHTLIHATLQWMLRVADEWMRVALLAWQLAHVHASDGAAAAHRADLPRDRDTKGLWVPQGLNDSHRFTLALGSSHTLYVLSCRARAVEKAYQKHGQFSCKHTPARCRGRLSTTTLKL